MAEVRMSLEAAAKALGGLHPNTVRNRAKTGKIPFEKDNSGKWWVFIDPDKADNDAKKKQSTPSTPEPTNAGDFSHLELTIQTTSRELEAVRAERDALRDRASEADKLAALRAGLEAKISSAQQELGRMRDERAELKADHAEALADVRKDRDYWREEAEKWQKQAAAALRTYIERVDAASTVAAERPKWSWWPWR